MLTWRALQICFRNFLQLNVLIGSRCVIMHQPNMALFLDSSAHLPQKRVFIFSTVNVWKQSHNSLPLYSSQNLLPIHLFLFFFFWKGLRSWPSYLWVFLIRELHHLLSPYSFNPEKGVHIFHGECVTTKSQFTSTQLLPASPPNSLFFFGNDSHPGHYTSGCSWFTSSTILQSPFRPSHPN